MIRWIARGLSVISIGIIASFFIGGANPGFSLEWNEALLMLFFPVGIILGMLIGWKHEFTGGAISVVSLLLFYSIHSIVYGAIPKGPFFVLFTLPGFLFLWVGFKNHFRGAETFDNSNSVVP